MYIVERYVGECIQSLLDQSFTDFEAIFVDDGSTDNTLSVAQSLVAGDERFSFLSQENAGQSAARNKALAVAQGDFVLFLDSDDAFVPQTIERLMGVRDQLDLDAVYFTAKMNYEDRNLVRTHFETYADRVGEEDVLNGFDMMVHFHKTESFRPSACMYLIRRSVLEGANLRFYEGIIHEDLLLTLQLFPYIGRCVFLNEALYVRRMRHGSTMTKPRSIENVHGLFTVARETEKQLREHLDEWPQDYIDAICNRIYNTWDTMARDAVELGEETIAAYRDTLTGEDRVAFNLNVLEPGRYMSALQHFYTDSTSFKLGRALLAGPGWVKDRFIKVPE